MKRIASLLICLLLAALFYARGFAAGAVSMIVLGGLFELGFWVQLLRRR